MSTTRSPALRALSNLIHKCPRQSETCQTLPIIVSHGARTINTTSTLVENDAMPHDLLTTPPQQEITSIPPPTFRLRKTNKIEDHIYKKAFSPRYSLSRTPFPLSSVSQTSPQTTTTTASFAAIPTTPPQPSKPSLSLRKPLTIPASVLQNLPHLASQPPYYINIHIHGRPYLVTAGDTLRLPFLMHGVLPGDVLRLDRASAFGSRDWTLKAGLAPLDADVDGEVEEASAASMSLSPGKITEQFQSEILETDAESDLAPKTIYPPNRKPRFRQAYLDDRLFVCRAVVLGTESEPMRIKEKTKRRQRRVKKVKSKHRFTVLKIGEVSLRRDGTGMEAAVEGQGVENGLDSRI